MPFSLPVGMGATLVGLILLAAARTFPALLVAAALVGTGSSVFHPESSRVARMASGGQHGLAQSIFQVGGNAGLSLGPLLAAFVVLPKGQNSLAWFSLAALTGMVLLTGVSSWAKNHRSDWKKFSAARILNKPPDLSTGRITASIAILMALLFSKFVYLASLTSYYTFYLISKFQLSVRKRANSSLCISGRRRARHPHRRTRRRSYRPQECHLGLDSWRSPVHFAFAVFQSVLD